MRIKLSPLSILYSKRTPLLIFYGNYDRKFFDCPIITLHLLFQMKKYLVKFESALS